MPSGTENSSFEHNCIQSTFSFLETSLEIFNPRKYFFLWLQSYTSHSSKWVKCWGFSNKKKFILFSELHVYCMDIFYVFFSSLFHSSLHLHFVGIQSILKQSFIISEIPCMDYNRFFCFLKEFASPLHKSHKIDTWICFVMET